MSGQLIKASALVLKCGRIVLYLKGDSGGPILIRVDENGQSVPYLIGVTSFGQGCAGAAPSIYTRTSAYIRWIESIVWPRG